MFKKENKNSWATGGGLIAGLGTGMLFLPQNPLAFVAFILIGLGVGLVMTAFLDKK